MAQSVKTNYILNLINTGSQMLFPLITFPYVCRVIEAEGIGLTNFYGSIIGYISLFTSLGIPLYAIREIARVRNDAEVMSKTVVEILSIHSLMSILGYIAIAILCATVPQIQENIPLFLISSANILFGVIGCEWFYQGTEDFKYITIRGIIVKLISVILLFIFVRTKDDLLLYGAYGVIGTLGGNIFNFIRLKKFVKLSLVKFKELNLGKHIKPILNVFMFSIVTSLYLQLNPVLLGFLGTTVAVGYFSASTRLLMMVMRVSSSLGTVVMPRVSHLISENKMDEFKALVQKSYNFVMFLTLPLAALLICCAPSVIHILSGDEFEPAILASQIIASNIVMVGISNVMGMQVLYPQGKVNIVTICCIVGAVTNVILNVILIPHLLHIGTAIAYAGAEIATTVAMYFIAKKYLPIKFYNKQVMFVLLATIVMSVAMMSISPLLETSHFILLVVQGVVGVVIYFSLLYWAKNPFVFMVFDKVKTKILRK